MREQMEKMIQLASVGVSVVLIGPKSKFNWENHWEVDLEKTSGEMRLELKGKGASPEEAIDEAFAKWTQATKGMPEHGLLQIEHQAEPVQPPTALDEEEPF